MQNKTFAILIFLGAVILAAVFTVFSMLGNSMEHSPGPDANLILAHDKGNLPKFQHSFSLQGREAESQTGIGFVPAPSLTTDLFIHQMKARLPTRQAPALFTWWSTWRAKELVDYDLVNDLTHLWDLYADDYPKEIRDAYTIEGRVYGFPYSLEYWPVWYNKPLFEKLGIQEPLTWDEFTKACKTLKNASVVPILTSVQLKWYSCIWFAALVMGEDPRLYEQLCTGQVKYTDERIVRVMDIWMEMIGKGWFSEPSANMFTNGGHLWNNEKFGMVLCGSWYYSMVLREQGVKDDDIGVFILPPHNPGAAKSIMMESGPVFTAKNSVYSNESEIIARWWMSPEGSRHFARVYQSYSASTKAGEDHLPPAKKKLLSSIKNQDCLVLNRYWEAAPACIVDPVIEALSRFMLNPGEKEAVIEEMQQAAEKCGYKTSKDPIEPW